MTTYQCKVCGNAQGNQVVVAREMMLGFRDSFTYFKCPVCGCLQIAEVPTNLSKYYPSDYTSFLQVTRMKTSRLKSFIGSCLMNLYLKGFLCHTFPYVRGFHWIKSLKMLKLKKSAAILDFGSGAGRLLLTMKAWGYKNLTGLDAFIERDILYPSGVRVLKTDIYNFSSPPPSKY
jgi:rubredoxin